MISEQEIETMIKQELKVETLIVNDLSAGSHNHFGIVGDCNFEISKHQSKYKYYSNIQDSYIGFCNLVKNRKFYESIKGTEDEKVWFRKIASTGYAADATKWANACIKICENNCSQ